MLALRRFAGVTAMIAVGRAAAAQSPFPARDLTVHLGATAGSVSLGAGTSVPEARYGVTLGVDGSVRLTSLLRFSVGAGLMQGGGKFPIVATVFTSGLNSTIENIDQVWSMDYWEMTALVRPTQTIDHDRIRVDLLIGPTLMLMFHCGVSDLKEHECSDMNLFPRPATGLEFGIEATRALRAVAVGGGVRFNVSLSSPFGPPPPGAVGTPSVSQNVLMFYGLLRPLTL